MFWNALRTKEGRPAVKEGREMTSARQCLTACLACQVQGNGNGRPSIALSPCVSRALGGDRELSVGKAVDKFRVVSLHSAFHLHDLVGL